MSVSKNLLRRTVIPLIALCIITSLLISCKAHINLPGDSSNSVNDPASESVKISDEPSDIPSAESEPGQKTDTVKDTETAGNNKSTQSEQTQNTEVKEPKEDKAVLPEEKTGYKAQNPNTLKAMWLSQFDLSGIYCNGKAERSEESFRKLIKKIIDNIKDYGFNTIIVQARPNADSMYPSEIYPQSKYINGSYGKYSSYDKFAIIVEEAHAAGLAVHGWINPMRAMSATEIISVGKEYRIKQIYSDSTKNGKYIVNINGQLYLNPAYEEIRDMIINGAKELLLHYELDGLHMDDYFYPTTADSFDSAARNEFASASQSKESFRRDCLNKLVSGLYKMVHETREGALFGISPSGVINKVYNEHCADIYEWGSKSGYVDYICPQLYFGFEHATCAFDRLFEQWSTIVKNPDVDLYVGISLGKAKAKVDNYAGSGKYEWAEHTDITYRQLEYLVRSGKCDSIAYFCYQYFFNPLTSKKTPETLDEVNNLIPYLKTVFND